MEKGQGKVVAVILAGGSGTRFGGNVPKQFLEIAGKPVLVHTVEAFERNDGIEEIAIVSNPNFSDVVHQLVADFNLRKVQRILLGGKERYLSSLSAIQAYEDNDWLIFHDAVRPLISQRIINDCINARHQFDAVDVAIKTTDTIIQVQEGNICGIPPRAFLWNGQTPQCFRRSVIKRAYEIALKDPGFITTDDCGVVYHYLPDCPIRVIGGELRNMKITNMEDLDTIKYLWNL